MPSFITHALAAEEAAPRLPRPLRSIVEGAPDYYFFGAQGPDFLFFLPGSHAPEKNTGKILHRTRVYELFCAFAAVLAALPEDDTRAAAYAYGYVSHYCADATFHPFVYRYLDEHRAGKLAHQQLENDWDVYFARTLRGREAERYPLPVRAAALVREGVLYRFWTAVLQKLALPVPAKGAFARAVRGYLCYLRAFHGRCYAMQRGLSRLERLFGRRGLSCLYPGREPAPDVISGEAFERIANADRRHPPAASADDFMERAVQTSAYRICLLADAVHGAPLPREEFDRHLLTGEHITAQSPRSLPPSATNAPRH